MIKIPVVLTKSQQALTIANYLPGGSVFGAAKVTGTNIRNLLLAFANELLQADFLISKFRIDIVPDETEHFIDEWEKAVGIPDSCFDGSGTDIERRLAIVVKLASLGIQTDSDFITLAAKFGLVVTVESGAVHGTFPYELPIKIYATEKIARFTIIVRPLTIIGETFIYTFPLTFGTKTLGIVLCIFDKVKPANVDVVFEDPI
jgi:hypothetical protein